MGLNALDIYKLLPKTNCGKCGCPTCLAFAMKLTTKKASIEDCPDISPQAKASLLEATTPPIKLVTLGSGREARSIGHETVLFRHEKTFFNPTLIAVEIGDDLDMQEIKKLVNKIETYKFERVGEELRIEMIALSSKRGKKERFVETVKEIRKISSKPLLLIVKETEILEAALEVSPQNTLIYSRDNKDFAVLAELSKKFASPLVISGKSLSDLAERSKRFKEMGIDNLVLEVPEGSLKSNLADLTQIRRLAIKENFRPLGFPAILFINDQDSFKAGIKASLGILKYASILVLPDLKYWQFLSLLVVRQNIYTDPQKPLQVEPGLYGIGEPKTGSPLIVTTNFSLTYFTVSGEIEAGGMPAHMLIVEAEGMSVLTAWAAGKFTPAQIAAAVKKYKPEEKLGHKKIIIPGYVAVLSGDLEEELPDWEIMVGPNEAADIPAYFKKIWNPVK